MKMIAKMDEAAFPAHAGMNRVVEHEKIDALRVPRACGDEPPPRKLPWEMYQRSPRMRG